MTDFIGRLLGIVVQDLTSVSALLMLAVVYLFFENRSLKRDREEELEDHKKSSDRLLELTNKYHTALRSTTEVMTKILDRLR